MRIKGLNMSYLYPTQALAINKGAVLAKKNPTIVPDKTMTVIPNINMINSLLLTIFLSSSRENEIRINTLMTIVVTNARSLRSAIFFAKTAINLT